MGCQDAKVCASAPNGVPAAPGYARDSSPANGGGSQKVAAATVADATESVSTAPSDSQEPTPRGTSCRRATTADGEIILGRYSFGSDGRRVLGQGASSMCYWGVDLETGASVAIKEYKIRRGGRSVALQMFKRQVDVLLQLQEPFRPPADGTLWSAELARAKPSDLFVQLLDYSKDATGKPGQDPTDGSMYVVTELAERTLKDELRRRRERARPLSAEQVRTYAHDIVLAVAGLHAKDFVHIDLKPENIVFCGGRWKLIDMDGCARAGATISLSDHWVSFSPCYTAPEFAAFVVDERSTIEASPGLDAWSVGMTIAELVNLQPLLQPTYKEFGIGRSARKAGELFLEWLGGVTVLPTFGQPGSADRDAFFGFLENSLLVVKKSQRKSLAQCLSAPYFAARGEDIDAA